MRYTSAAASSPGSTRSTLRSRRTKRSSAPGGRRPRKSRGRRPPPLPLQLIPNELLFHASAHSFLHDPGLSTRALPPCHDMSGMGMAFDREDFIFPEDFIYLFEVNLSPGTKSS